MTTGGSIVIANGQVITPAQTLAGGAVVVEGERITRVEGGMPADAGDATIIDAAGMYVIPGFIDIHVHGGAGCDVMDATPEALDTMSAFFARHGVTSFLATTMTGSREATLAAVENVARWQPRPDVGARLLGVHLEGPYINARFPGAQMSSHIRPAERAEYEQFFAHGNVRLITLAPEIAANQELIGFARGQGAAVAFGHTAATYDDVLRAVELGARQACHTFNAMVGLHHRDPGTAGAALTCDQIYAQAIVDFVHLHPAVVKLILRVKGVQRTVLITDAMRAAGLPDGAYSLGGQPVTVRNGEARLTEGNNLAGSTLTMDRGLRNVIAATGLSLAEALPLATTTPAESIMMEETVGALRPGYFADLVLLDDALRVRMTMVKGTIVFQQ